MNTVGTFQSRRWGKVTVLRGHYQRADGPVAVQLVTDAGPLATLSVNMYRPECSHDSSRLPADCFYVKQWEENEAIADEAFASGLFALREDLGTAQSGFVTAPVWQIKAREHASADCDAKAVEHKLNRCMHCGDWLGEHDKDCIKFGRGAA